jgi:hypothetical protein
MMWTQATKAQAEEQLLSALILLYERSRWNERGKDWLGRRQQLDGRHMDQSRLKSVLPT